MTNTISNMVPSQEDINLSQTLIQSDGGYEFTGGFTERTTGQSGANDLGTNFQYTEAMATAGTWKRFGFDTTRQVANDVQ